MVIGDCVGFSCLPDATGRYANGGGAAGGCNCVADEYERGNDNTAGTHADSAALDNGRAISNSHTKSYSDKHANAQPDANSYGNA